MTEDSIYDYRQLEVFGRNSEIHIFTGRQVHSANDKGVIVVTGENQKLRTFYPWHRIHNLTAHGRDEILSKIATL